MLRDLKEEEIKEIVGLFRKDKYKISIKEIRNNLKKIVDSQNIFPLDQQRTLILRLLHTYESTKKKEVIILEEFGDKKAPVTIILGALAEDWPGMSNSVLGIIHHMAGNVLFVKGFTVELKKKAIGLVLLSFRIKSKVEYKNFLNERKSIIKKIKEASKGSLSKSILLDEEIVKSDIFEQIVKRIKKVYKNPDINELINEEGEALKFVLSRSREYLEERRIKDLAEFIIENYKCQKYVRDGNANEIIKIRNFETDYEKLTGITFVCTELMISIEDFLKTLDYLVPDNKIKHHKSFITRDGLLVYRIEIVDRFGSQLNPIIIRSIENSLKKLVISSHNSRFASIKTVGGFEHFARAIIPFLMDELERTKMTQVFLNVTNKTDFYIEIKSIIIRDSSNRGKIITLIPEIDRISGVDINSFIPTKIYREKYKVDIFKLNISLSEFDTVREIFDTLKTVIKKEFGEIRDFDQGLRDIYISTLTKLLKNLNDIDPDLIKEIFFNFDELYRIEINFDVIAEVIKMCSELIYKSKDNGNLAGFFKYKHHKELHRTIIVVSCFRKKSLIKIFLDHFKGINLNFSKFYRDQKKYYILILDNKNNIIDELSINNLKSKIKKCE
ncbi:MAG: hypothetical protein ABFR75_01800 [Acidobacteriota bacterium]